MKKLTIVLIGFLSTTAYAEDEMAITPYRPSVSSPAQLPLAGQLELEVGGLRIKSGETQRDSIPYQLKLAFSKEWGVLLGGEAHVLMRNEDGTHDRGIGDTTLVIKRAIEVDASSAFGAEIGVKLPTANTAIGSGKSDYVVNAIYSKDIASLHVDGNLNATRLGIAEPGTSRVQTGLSSSFSVPLAAQWGATAELSGTYRKGTAVTGQVLVAGTFSPSKRMAIDFGVAKGLTRASQDWSFFTGIVVPVAKLW